MTNRIYILFLRKRVRRIWNFVLPCLSQCMCELQNFWPTIFCLGPLMTYISVQHVDEENSYICGYLKIKNLTDEYPEMVTFFDGEIIRFFIHIKILYWIRKGEGGVCRGSCECPGTLWPLWKPFESKFYQEFFMKPIEIDFFFSSLEATCPPHIG